mmetsp:Transcript_10791/g.19856  ORF Transcript_10791/g.19856 Transcript_10791/m.19856 type:complete len:295 (-) Transcript_10791:1119-2003(-)
MVLSPTNAGKAARASGKNRTLNFQQALQAATIEIAKPMEMRMDWNHTEQPQILPSPQKKKLKVRKRSRGSAGKTGSTASSASEKVSRSKGKKRAKLEGAPHGFALLPDSSQDSQAPSKRNLLQALEAVGAVKHQNAKAIVESAEDGEIFLKLLKKPNIPSEETKTNDNPGSNVGFVKLKSRKTSSFADARLVIQDELVPDVIPPGVEWRFFVPGLGPVSSKQEGYLGPIFSFLRRTTTDVNLGDGTLMNPLKVFIVELEEVRGRKEESDKTQNSPGIGTTTASPNPDGTKGSAT